MSTTKRSCWFKGCIGCSSVFGIGILIMVVIFGIAWVDKPIPPEFTTFEAEQAFESEGQALNLPLVENKKPIRIHLQTSMCNIKMMANEAPGAVDVNAEYDKANFEMTTEVKESEDVVDYYISLKNKHTIFSFMHDDGNLSEKDVKNQLTIKLPKDRLLSFVTKTSMGELKANLGGLAISSIESDAKMGGWEWSMSEPNQVEMERLDVVTKMGETKFNDLQNLRVKTIDVTNRFGQFTMRNSGILTNDIDIHTDVKMGEARYILPAETAIKSSFSVMLGEAKTPPSQEPHPGQARVKMNGSVVMGGIVVANNDMQKETAYKYRKKFEDLGVDAALEELLNDEKLLTEDFDDTFLNRIGYRYLNDQQFDDAIKVFEANLKLFPEMPNCYDSLGEAYMLKGDKEKAIENYKKCLQLNPYFHNAKEMLEKLESETD